MKNDYYVYVYCDPRSSCNLEFINIKFDKVPFYVGKGRGTRIEKHLKEKKGKRKNKRIELLKNEDKVPIIRKLFDGLTENQAFYLEACFIEHFKLVEDGGFLLNEVKPNVKKWDERQESPAITYESITFNPYEIVKYPTIKYVLLKDETFDIVSIHYSTISISEKTGLTRSLIINLSENSYPENCLRGFLILKTSNLIKFLDKKGKISQYQNF